MEYKVPQYRYVCVDNKAFRGSLRKVVPSRILIIIFGELQQMFMTH